MTSPTFRPAIGMVAVAWLSIACDQTEVSSVKGSGDGGAASGGGKGTGGMGGSGFGGLGGFAGAAGTGGAGGISSAECGLIDLTLRDFQGTHPDFEVYAGKTATLGIVAPDLGSDRKPVFASVGNPQMVTSPESFAQWYQDVTGINQTVTVQIRLQRGASGVSVYDNSMFFPLDNMGFGNENRQHNFHFTTEVHLKFKYEGREVFTFRGDDDLWLFVNGKLALDLGGLHSVLTGTVDLDSQAAALGITPGNEYTMDIFHAERHTAQSNFRIETTIGCIRNVIE